MQASAEVQLDEARRINAALNDFVLWSSGTSGQGTKAEKREWCLALAATCRDLLHGLGLEGLSHLRTPENWSRYWEARMHLAEGQSALFADDPHNSTLNLLLLQARHGANWEDVNSPEIGGALDFAMERIGGSLGALAIIAERAADRFSGQMVRGGKKPHYLRNLLFVQLGASFERLFGRPASSWTRQDSARPTGPALEWHRTLLELVSRRVREPAAGDHLNAKSSSIEEANPPSASLVTLAERAAGIGGKKGQAPYYALAHWIRAAAKHPTGWGNAN